MYKMVGLVPPVFAIIEEDEDLGGSGKEWPSDLKLLIEKSFEKCYNRNEQLTMKQLLKNLITKAEGNKELHRKSW